MKKVTNSKVNASKKKTGKASEDGELKKPNKLKPLKEKERKGWKNKIGEDDDDFLLDEDLKFDNNFDENDDELEDDYYEDEY